MNARDQALAIIDAELKTIENESDERVKELYNNDFVALSGFSAKEIHDRMNDSAGCIKIIPPEKALIYMMDGFMYGELSKEQRLGNVMEIRRRFTEFHESSTAVLTEEEQRGILDLFEKKYGYVSYMNSSGCSFDILNINYGWNVDSFIGYFPPCYIQMGSLARRPDAPIGKYSVFARHLAMALQIALTGSIANPPASFRQFVAYCGVDYDARYRTPEEAFNEFANFFAASGLFGSEYDDWPAEAKMHQEGRDQIDGYLMSVMRVAIKTNKIINEVYAVKE